jgi:hypothetical protein
VTRTVLLDAVPQPPPQAPPPSELRPNRREAAVPSPRGPVFAPLRRGRQTGALEHPSRGQSRWEPTERYA